MKKLISHFGSFLYHALAQFLPRSSYFFGIGKGARKVCAKMMLCTSKMGKNVNIERHADFSGYTEIGITQELE